MALIKCPDCGKEFSEYAECCPECGCPVDAAKESNVEKKPQEETANEVSTPQSTIFNEPQQIQQPQRKKPLGLIVAIVILSLVVVGLVATFVVMKYFDNSDHETASTEILQSGSEDGNNPHITESPTVPTEDYEEDDGCPSLHLTGFIGGGEDATFIYDRQTDSGHVEFTINGIYNKRSVKNATYDSKTGRLVVEEFFVNGGYIGDFVGTYKNGIYSGVFTNKNTGGKVDFKLSTQGHV